MKSLWMAAGIIKTILTWLRDVKRTGESRLSKERAQADRLELERIAHAMRTANTDALPRSVRWICVWLAKLGLLDDIGTYLTTLLKSQKLTDGSPELYRIH